VQAVFKHCSLRPGCLYTHTSASHSAPITAAPSSTGPLAAQLQRYKNAGLQQASITHSSALVKSSPQHQEDSTAVSLLRQHSRPASGGRRLTGQPTHCDSHSPPAMATPSFGLSPARKHRAATKKTQLDKRPCEGPQQQRHHQPRLAWYEESLRRCYSDMLLALRAINTYHYSVTWLSQWISTSHKFNSWSAEDSTCYSYSNLESVRTDCNYNLRISNESLHQSKPHLQVNNTRDSRLGES
jgi:hypothetical protein